jgi:hypothetical protein
MKRFLKAVVIASIVTFVSLVPVTGMELEMVKEERKSVIPIRLKGEGKRVVGTIQNGTKNTLYPDKNKKI